jgi:2-aminomuconate deaminase
VTVFLTNIDRDFAAFNRVYAEYFETIRTRPTRTTVGVVALPVPISIELKIIAES